MSLGPWQILIVVFYLAVIIIPFWGIFPRAGMHGAMSILMVIPLINLMLLWVLAFKRWSNDHS